MRQLPKLVETQRARRGILLTIMILLCGCGARDLNPESATTLPTQQHSEPTRPGEPVNAATRSLEIFFHGNLKGKEAWERFTADGRYRLARADEFTFSDAAKKQLASSIGPDWAERKLEKPYTGGEINHDGAYKDTAFIVVDTTRNDAERFGVVIFNEQEGADLHKPYWLYEGVNLSAAIFSWTRDGLQLEQYDENGKYRICYVNWNKKIQKYTCDAWPSRNKGSSKGSV